MSVNLIYLAGGNSKRFGSNKLFYPFHGKCLYRYGLDALIQAAKQHPDWHIFVVSQYEALVEDVKEEAPNVHAIWEPACKDGVSYSIRAGIRAAENVCQADYYGFFVADQPYMTANTVEAFFCTMEREKKMLGCVQSEGEDGNPTCFFRSFLPELMELSGDKGGRRVLKSYPSLLWKMEVAKKELMDFDVKPVE